MLSISPTSANICDAVPTASSIFALHGLRYDEKPASNARLVKTAGGGLTTLTAEEIQYPSDWDDPSPQPHVIVQKFAHVPTITYRRGEQVETITGPITPTIPHMTEATRLGWEKWWSDRAAHIEAAIEDSRQRAAKQKAYFQARQDKNDADWDAKCARALERGKPLPKRPKYREPPPNWLDYVKDEKLVEMISAARHMRNKSKRIREYKHNGGAPIGGRIYESFQESFDQEDGRPAPAIRSWLGPISLSLFSSALPRGDVKFGYDKEIEYSISETDMSRIFALDHSHIVLDKYRRCAFIVDLDGWWVSVEALRSHLRKMLPPEFMPNILTSRGAEAGKGGVENPHLIWMLPPGSRVLRGKGKNKKQQFKLHDMVQSGIVSLLIPLGADPGHTNVFKTKNPLSPGYSIEVCDDYFQTMDEWRSFLPTITPNRREMQRRAKIHNASQQSGAEVSASQAIWNDGKNFRRIEIAAAQRRQDPAFLKSRNKVNTFIDWLYDDDDGVVTKRLIDEHGDTPAARSVLRAQRQFVVDLDMTPLAIGEWCDRGRDADLNAEELKPLPRTATKEERVARERLIKHRARQRTQANKQLINCGLIAEEIEARLAGGVPVVKAEVVNALVNAGTVKRSTAYAHFDYCLEIVQRTARYQDRPLSTVSEQSSQQRVDPPVIMSEAVSGNETSESFGSESQVNAPVRDPAKSTRTTLPTWVVDKDTLTEWEDACWIREVWSEAVANGRKAKQKRATCDVDPVKDERFWAMIIDRSVWSHRRH